MTRLNSILVVFLASASLMAQSSTGFLAGAPVALIEEEDSTQSIVAKEAGFVPVSGLSVASVDFDALSRKFEYRAIEIAAMSLGIDVLRVRVTGDKAQALIDPDHGWLALQFTIDKENDLAMYDDLKNSAAPDAIKNEGADNVGRAVFSYVFPGSKLEGVGEDDVTRSLSGDEMGVSHDIGAFNAHLALYEYGEVLEDPLLSRELPAEPTLYFAIGEASLKPMGEWLDGVAQADTIYQISWSSATRKWSTPSAFMNRTQLGMTAADEWGTLDGLAVDVRITGDNYEDDHTEVTRVLYSFTSPPSAESELMIAFQATSPAKYLYSVDVNLVGLIPVGEHIGAGTAIGDFCDQDPFRISRGQQPGAVVVEPLIYVSWAIAERDANPSGPATLPASGFRYYNEFGHPAMATMLTWDVPRPSRFAKVIWRLEARLGNAWVPKGVLHTEFIRLRGRPSPRATLVVPMKRLRPMVREQIDVMYRLSCEWQVTYKGNLLWSPRLTLRI